MKIGSYNGWNGEERLAVLPIIRAALEAGQMDPPSRCSICLVAGSPDWRAADAIVFHDEDYANPLAAYTSESENPPLGNPLRFRTVENRSKVRPKSGCRTFC